jgi:GTP cyclohydrolase IA
MVEFAKTPPTLKEGEECDASRPAMSSSFEQETPNGKFKRKSDDKEGQSKKKKRKSKSERRANINGSSLHSKRRHSVSKPARDPRDEASPSTSELEVSGTRSPSPVIDFDGLSRPSISLCSTISVQILSVYRQRNPRTS